MRDAKRGQGELAPESSQDRTDGEEDVRPRTRTSVLDVVDGHQGPS